MTALRQPLEAQFVSMTEDLLDAVMALENAAYAKPWKRQHFSDCLQAGYCSQLLMAGDTLIGYFVAMQGVEEVHLLNITVAPRYQRQGWAKVLLDALAMWAAGQRAQWLWLEVRAGNSRAIAVYQARGFANVGRRKQYYPAENGQREDALVMGLRLGATALKTGTR